MLVFLVAHCIYALQVQRRNKPSASYPSERTLPPRSQVGKANKQCQQYPLLKNPAADVARPACGAFPGSIAPTGMAVALRGVPTVSNPP